MFAIKEYRQQYASNLRLAMPVVMTQMGQIMVQLFDNAMVGHLGALPLAAVSYAGTVFFLLFAIAIGISLGITPLVGESYAQGRHRDSARYLQNSIALYTVVGFVLVMLLLLARPLMYRLGQPVEVVDMAIPYYSYLVWSILPFMLFASFKQFLEGIGNTKVAMVIVVTSNLLNIFLNWVFIYGKLGAPAMGAAGAGLATLIARLLTPLMVIWYFMHHRRLRRYLNFFKKEGFSLGTVRSLLGVGFPISLQMFMEGSAFCFTSIMMGWISTVAIAANQIATVTANLTFMILIGVSSATTIRVSHEWGRRDWKSLRRAATASYHIGLMYNFIMGVTIVSLRRWLPMMFTTDPEVVELTSKLLVFVALFQISDGLQNISVGILRGMQDVRITIVIAFFSYLVINLPVGYLLAFVAGWGAEGLWVGYIFGLSVAAVLLNARFRRKIGEITRNGQPD